MISMYIDWYTDKVGFLILQWLILIYVSTIDFIMQIFYQFVWKNIGFLAKIYA